MSYKDDLIQSIPLFQQNSVALQQYIETSGEVFDELVGAIDNFKTYYDYANVSEERLDDLSALFDLRFFANLDEYGRRKFAKDAAKLYQKLGTKQALEYIFKIIGMVVEVDNMWMLAPVPDSNNITWLYNGTLTYREADVGAYYNSFGTRSPVAPLQLIKGETEILEDGTYVNLKYGSPEYRKWRIYGEEYAVTEDRTNFFMIKVPYYNINITEESYNLYIDADGDGSLDYIDQEKIDLAKDLVNFTLEEYLGANEVVLGVNLLDVNEDHVSDYVVISDDDFFMNIDAKDATERRISTYTIPSAAAFGEITIETFVSTPSIPSDELFGTALVIWDATVDVNSVDDGGIFGNLNIYNETLWVNNFDITSSEAFGAVDVNSIVYMIPDGIATTEAFENDANIVETNFITLTTSIPSAEYIEIDTLVDYRVKFVDVGSIDAGAIPQPEFVYNAGSDFILSVGDINESSFEDQSIVSTNGSILIQDNTQDITSEEAFGVASLPVVVPSIVPDDFVTEHGFVYDSTDTFLPVTQERTDSIVSDETFGTAQINKGIVFGVIHTIISAEAFSDDAELTNL